MNKNLELDVNEKVRASMKCHREVKNVEVLMSFFTNLFVATNAPIAAGEVVNEYIVTLTDKNLYLQGIYHTPIGGTSEVCKVSKLPLDNIRDFKVEEKGKEELVTILVNKGRNLKLIHKNDKWTNDAMKIKELYF